MPFNNCRRNLESRGWWLLRFTSVTLRIGNYGKDPTAARNGFECGIITSFAVLVHVLRLHIGSFGFFICCKKWIIWLWNCDVILWRIHSFRFQVISLMFSVFCYYSYWKLQEIFWITIGNGWFVTLSSVLLLQISRFQVQLPLFSFCLAVPVIQKAQKQDRKHYGY